jgi:hypothetical protein
MRGRRWPTLRPDGRGIRATVGYGDRYPVTNAGRLEGILMVTVGVGLVGVLSGFLADAVLRSQPSPAERADGSTASTRPQHPISPAPWTR